MLDPTAGCARTRQDGDTLIVTIAAKRRLFVAAFLGFWLIMWALGWLSAAGSLLGGHSRRRRPLYSGMVRCVDSGGRVRDHIISLVGRRIRTHCSFAIETHRLAPHTDLETSGRMRLAKRQEPAIRKPRYQPFWQQATQLVQPQNRTDTAGLRRSFHRVWDRTGRSRSETGRRKNTVRFPGSWTVSVTNSRLTRHVFTPITAT